MKMNVKLQENNMNFNSTFGEVNFVRNPSEVKTVNKVAPDEDGDVLLYGQTEYEPKVTLSQSDMSRYLYLGADKKRWMTTPEDVTIRASFRNGAVVDFKTDSGLKVVDLKSNHLAASVYTVAGDRKLYVVFNQKVRITGKFRVCVVPYGALSDSSVAISDCVIAVDCSKYNLADILKNGYHDFDGNLIVNFPILWDDDDTGGGIVGENGEICEKHEVIYFWDADQLVHKFEYAGEVSSVADIPSSVSIYDQAMMSVGNDDMYICMGDDYLVQTVLRNFGVNTKSTYIIVKEELATTVSSVTILLGDDIIATLTQNDIASAFLGKRDTPSFDWLTSRYEVRFTVDGAVVEDLVVNGFDKHKNFISAYSSVGCFISGVNGLVGCGESNEYCVIINPWVASVNQVEIGSEPWKKIPHGAFPTDDVVTSGSVNLIESGAVKTYVDNTIDAKTKELKAYLELIEERLLALAKASGNIN